LDQIISHLILGVINATYPFYQHIGFLRKKLVNMALYGAETWTFRAAGQKYFESFEMWCWRRMEKISWTDHMRNEEVLLRVHE
jgi:hypothetical protein